MRHVTVFREDGVYTGWPANHGAWQWGDELLVGFLFGKYKFDPRFHSIQQPFYKALARSMDGGEHWEVERPEVDFEGDSPLPVLPTDLDLTKDIIRVCGNYDTGGEYCDKLGAFYRSSDKGYSWDGPYQFVGQTIERFFEPPYWNTSRTSTLGNLVFLSACDMKFWGGDYSFCAEFVPCRYPDCDGGPATGYCHVRCRVGSQFMFRGIICDDKFRCVMPKVVRLSPTHLVAVARRRGSFRAGCWIDCFESRDDGFNWKYLSHVADTGGSNGNPPALAERNGELWCVFGDRNNCAISVFRSSDEGLSWHWHQTLRQGIIRDIGYPQLFKRADGQLVCVYYWSEAGEPQHIEATIFEP